jgi:ABC-type Fe3+-siderophore transport system permease subunit
MFKPAFPSLSFHPYREWEPDLLFDADRAPLFAVAALCMFGRDLLGRWLLPLAMPALAVTLYVANRICRTPDHPYPWWSLLLLAITGLPFFWINIGLLRRTP